MCQSLVCVVLKAMKQVRNNNFCNCTRSRRVESERIFDIVKVYKQSRVGDGSFPVHYERLMLSFV